MKVNDHSAVGSVPEWPWSLLMAVVVIIASAFFSFGMVGFEVVISDCSVGGGEFEIAIGFEIGSGTDIELVLVSGNVVFVLDGEIIHGAIVFSQYRPLEVTALLQQDDGPPGLVSQPDPPHSPH